MRNWTKRRSLEREYPIATSLRSHWGRENDTGAVVVMKICASDYYLVIGNLVRVTHVERMTVQKLRILRRYEGNCPLA